MTLTRRNTLILLAGAPAAISLFPAVGAAEGATHEIQMLNRHPEDRKQSMLFYPAVLRIQPGDTVRFVATDRGHNALSIDGMTPDGAEPFGGKIGEEFEVTFTDEGTYGYKCQPHQAMGMLGLILVGNFTTNLDAVRTASEDLRGARSAKRFAEYLGEAERIAAEEGLN